MTILNMNRRAFLSLAAVSPLAGWLQTFAWGETSRELKADVVVIGGGVGGVACALAAARNGLRVILTEQYDWIGGQLTSQAVPPDEYPTIETFPCTKTYGAFRTAVREYYRRHYPLTDPARADPLLNPGNGSVSKLCHEPRVAVAVLLEMLAPHISGARVRIMQPCVPVRADMTGDRVAAVSVRNVFTAAEHTVTAPYFVDATELGELLPLTKTEYVSGAESRSDTGEPHAPSKANPANHQAFTVCFAMEHVEGEDHTVERPAEYEFWRGFVPPLTPAWPGKLLAWHYSAPTNLTPKEMGIHPTGDTPKGVYNLWKYRRIADRTNFAPGAYAGDVTLVNWPQNDYLLGNLHDDEDPAKHAKRGRELSRCLFYWMQTEAPRRDGGTGWKGLRLRPELMGTDDGMAMAPYVRESRRIKAMFTVTENHVGTDARASITGKKRGEFTAEQFPDTVGIGSYRIDLHPSTTGDNYIDVSALPFQIPLGSLIPRRVENLLAANKNIGTTHITNGCYRLHPVEWTIGEAAGETLAYCISNKATPRQVLEDTKRLASLQSKLKQSGFELAWPDDVVMKPR